MRPSDPAGSRADLLRRLHCAEGHLRGIAAMIERGEGCEAVLRQTLAVQAALGQINRLMIGHHLRDCLDRYALADDPAARRRQADELASLYEIIGRKANF